MPLRSPCLLLAALAVLVVFAASPATATWPTTADAALNLGSTTRWQSLVASVPDGQGGFWFAFSTIDLSEPLLRVQHVDAAGTRRFGEYGVPVNGTLGYTKVPSLLLAPDGGVYVAFTLQSEGNSYDLWLQRIAPDGTLLFGPDGILVERGADVAVAVGNGGTIARSFDGGESWEYVVSGTSQSQLGVVLLSTAIRTAGDNATLLTSDSFGSSWTTLNSGGAPDLNALDFQGSIGIAVGDLGRTWRWDYSFNRWEIQPAGNPTDLLGVSVRGFELATAVGDNGRIAVTSDGGATWTEQVSGVSGHLHDVCFPSVDVGTAVGNGGTILHTTDGGATWVQQASTTTSNLLSVDFLDEDFGIATGYSGLALYTHDGGATWNRGTTPVVRWYMGVSITDSQTAIAVGQDGVIIKTEDAGATWSLKQAPGGMSDFWEVDAPSNPVGQDSPNLVDDGTGGFILLWEDQFAGTYDVFAQRFDENGQELWPDHVRVSASSVNVYELDAVTRGGGGVVLAWSDLATNSDQILYSQAIDLDGNLLFPGSDVLSNFPAGKRDLQMVPDGLGGAMVAWADFRSIPLRIYGCRITSQGDARWISSDGKPVSVGEENNQTDPSLVPDPAGGAFYVWGEYRNGSSAIVAQRVDHDGNPSWPAADVVVNDDPQDQSRPAVTSDGFGGFVTAWLDDRSLGYRIHAQAVDAGGSLRWPAGPVAIHEGQGGDVRYTSHPIHALPDGNGGGYFVWGFTPLVGEGSPYAQRVDRHGYLGNPAALPNGVVDVPGDQGGMVTVSWDASYLDNFPHQVITHYTTWRRQGSFAKSIPVAELERTTAEALDAGLLLAIVQERAASGWVYLGTTPAYYLPSYGMDAPTYGTGPSPQVAPTEFQVVAHTDDPFVSWISTTVSGSSIDDLAPPAPMPLFASEIDGQVQLSWNDGAGYVADIDHYRVYRGAQSGFPVDESSLVGSAVPRDWLDPAPGSAMPHYRVTAVDVHGNEGPPSPEAKTQVVTAVSGAGDTRLALRLQMPYPNPSRGAATLRFSLPEAGPVEAELFDLAGRRVFREPWGSLPAGPHERVFRSRQPDGRRLASGTYFLRLRQGTLEATTKVVVTR